MSNIQGQVPTAQQSGSPHTHTDLINTEFGHLLAMIDNIGQHPDLHPDLPLPINHLRTTALLLHDTFNRHTPQPTHPQPTSPPPHPAT
ncbi:hypothetical protein ACFP3R_32275 [Saccharothrix lopnurensis]|uniref:Uncharacterized protein n=1 Tax=Saccharothrix lopnurensis TaxID=1670621 RepID=A0ABW1PEQ7_9PSEU